MRYTIKRNFVQVLGTIWMPTVTCAMEYPLTAYDVANIGEFTRENVEAWLDTHSGDFQSIKDFAATVGDEWINWADEENEFTYQDCMYPSDEPCDCQQEGCEG